MTCPWAGALYDIAREGRVPLPVPGIVLFFGTAIPGDIPHIWDSGDSGWVPNPRHYARNAQRGPSESVSGPAPKPMSRICPSVRSRPPRVSAQVGTQLLGSDEARENPRWQLSAARAEPTRRTTPGGGPASQGLPDLQTRLAGEMDARTGAASGWIVWTWGDLFVVNLRPETDPPPKRLSDWANSKNGRPYGPLWASRRMSGGVARHPWKSGSGPSRLGAVSEKVR
jgi:hypothetical protein